MSDDNIRNCFSADEISLMKSKNTHRQAIHRQIDMIPQKEKQRLGKSAASKLMHSLKSMKLLTSKSQMTVALFASKKDEISTAYLDYFLQIKKIHRVYPEFHKNKLAFRSIPQELQARDMQKDIYGIPTPDLNWSLYNSQKINLVIVPGLAFDQQFNRLGRGKGFYDSYIFSARQSARFKGNPAPLFIGFFLDLQQLKQCPHNARDQKLDGYCTPELGLVLNPKTST